MYVFLSCVYIDFHLFSKQKGIRTWICILLFLFVPVYGQFSRYAKHLDNTNAKQQIKNFKNNRQSESMSENLEGIFVKVNLRCFVRKSVKFFFDHHNSVCIMMYFVFQGHFHWKNVDKIYFLPFYLGISLYHIQLPFKFQPCSMVYISLDRSFYIK